MPTEPGWEAIQAKLTSVYGAKEPKHWATIQRYSEGGPDPLDGVSAYEAGPPPHWHYVTFGFSELYDKRSQDPAVSGWGFELSMRVKRRMGETAPPEWPMILLQNLARYVNNTKTPFDDEHFIKWGGPITKAEPTHLEALVFSLDPALGEIETPNGKLKFLRVFGITTDEHALADSAGPAELIKQLLAADPQGVVNLKRNSILAG